MKVFIILSLIYWVNANPNSRIRGGEPADISAYPFATALLRQQDNTFVYQCGGTILSTHAVLSAASCFFTGDVADEPSSWRARVGSSESNRLGFLHIIGRITTHPDYQRTTRVNDIAVLRVPMSFMFKDTIQAAYIAGGAYQLQATNAVQAIGWGATDADGANAPQLQQTTVWVAEQATCVSRYNGINFTVTDNMICAGWLGVGVRGQCQGDTGSPLVHNNVVVGVYSWSQGCADPQYPAINTRVSSYTRWIEATAVA